MELVELFEEMSREVEAAEPVVAKVEEYVQQTHQDLVQGNVELVVAKKHAWNTRKNKWICLGVVLLIIVIIAVILGVKLAPQKSNNNNNNNNTPA